MLRFIPRNIRYNMAKATLPIVGRLTQWHQYVETYTERERIIRLAFSYVKMEQVAGDYLEFGVYQGRTFTYAYHAATQRGLDGHFYAFDSFQGLPKPEGADAVSKRFKEGELSSSREYFERQLKRQRIDMDRVTIVPGWFDETLTEQTRTSLGLKPASVVLVDCDMYRSTVPVLEFITPLLRDGTVILFDDWFSYRADPTKGEQRAASEWLARNPAISLIEWRRFAILGQAFIVNIQE